MLGAIGEDSEDEDDEDEGYDGFDLEQATVDDVPQCFSHFTYTQSGGLNLVCDLQGVWNAYDGYMLTDPVIHHRSLTREKGSNGKTDKGRDGMKRCFETHRSVYAVCLVVVSALMAM